MIDTVISWSSKTHRNRLRDRGGQARSHKIEEGAENNRGPRSKSAGGNRPGHSVGTVMEAVHEIKDQGYNDHRGNDEQLRHISPDSVICLPCVRSVRVSLLISRLLRVLDLGQQIALCRSRAGAPTACSPQHPCRSNCQQYSYQRARDINPVAAEVGSDEVGPKRTRRVHRCTGDGAAPKTCEGDVGAHSERAKQANVLGAGRGTEDDADEPEREHGLMRGNRARIITHPFGQSAAIVPA